MAPLQRDRDVAIPVPERPATHCALSLFESVAATSSVPDAGSIAPSIRRALMIEHPTLAVAAIEKGRIRETNVPWRALFAVPPGVSIEWHVATLFPNAGSADRFERSLLAELTPPSDDDKRIARAEHLLVRRDGTAFLAEVVVCLFGNEGVEHPFSGDAIWQIRDITVERTLRRELRDLEDYHRELSRHQGDLTFVIDRKGRISYASSSIETALGYRVQSMLGEPFASLLDPEHAAAAERALRAASRGTRDQPKADDGFQLHVLHEDGRVRVLSCRARDCFSVACIAGMVLHAIDVTESPPVDEPGRFDEAGSPALRGVLMELAASGLEVGDDAVEALLDRTHEALAVSTATLWMSVPDGPARTWRSSRSTKDDPVQRPLSNRIGAPAPWLPLVVNDVRHSAFAPGDGGPAAVVEVPIVAEGALRGWLSVGSQEPRQWATAELDFLVGIALLLAAATEPEATGGAPVGHRDPLTGLPGRIQIESELVQRAAVLNGGDTLTLLLIDIDGMQDVNDGHGFRTGDGVIARTARSLVQLAGSSAFVARSGGDEFVVAVAGLSIREVDALVAAVVDGVGESTNDPTEDALHLPRVDVCIGVACYPTDTADAGLLLSHAHLAMREAKGRGCGQAVSFQPRLDVTLHQRNALDAEIEQALENSEITLFYQPQLSLTTGLAVGLEALLRWEHPTKGLLLPGTFIDVVFKRGLIEAITKSVLTQVCEQIAAWRRSGGLPDLPVAVNISVAQFHDRRLPALVASALLKSGLPARLLVLEIAERSLTTDAAAVEHVARELSRLGVRVAIADFSLAHAAFKYQRQLSVSQVKLNAGFVKGVPSDAACLVAVTALLEVAHRLKYQVVAEGVETREQFEHLRTIGCDEGQGFYFGAPLSAIEIRSFLESNLRSPVR